MLRSAADSHDTRCRLYVKRPSSMKPLTLRTKLTLFYSITVSVLLTGFALIYYNVLSAGLDRDLTQEVLDRTSGLRGYLHFEEGMPVFVYDQNDPDEVSFLNKAMR